MIAIFPEIAAAVSSRDLEVLAVLVRKYFGGDSKRSPRPCLDSMLALAGIPQIHNPLQYLAALVAKDEKGRFEVAAILSDEAQLPECELRFLLAHQLGHYFLHIQPLIARGEWRASGRIEQVSPQKRYEDPSSVIHLDHSSSDLLVEEDEADRFAASLLMPAGMVKKAYQELGQSKLVAQFFAVTPAVAERRLHELSSLDKLPTAAPAADAISSTLDTRGIGRLRELARRIDPGVK